MISFFLLLVVFFLVFVLWLILKCTKKSSLVVRSLIVATTIVVVPILCIGIFVGMFFYGIHQQWSNFTLRRVEVTEHIQAIYDFRAEHNRYPKDIAEEISHAIPHEWEYIYNEEDDSALLLLNRGKLRLKFDFENEGTGTWSFYVEGSRMNWSRITRPLPSDPK